MLDFDLLGSFVSFVDAGSSEERRAKSESATKPHP
jgi:hypothetical protein